MLYRCRNCNYEEARGCLPPASCGLYLLGLMGLAGAMLIPAVRYIRSIARTASESVNATEQETGGVAVFRKQIGNKRLFSRWIRPDLFSKHGAAEPQVWALTCDY